MIFAEVDERVIESENYPTRQCINGTCLWEIEPHSEKDIRLEILDINLSVQSTIQVFILSYNHEKKLTATIEIKKYDRFSDNDHKHFQLPKNTGVLLKFISNDMVSNGRGFKISMKRVENNNSSCSQTYSEITEHQHFIEKTGPLNVSCYYNLWKNTSKTIPDEKVLYVLKYMTESMVWLFHKDDNNKFVRTDIYNNTALLVNTGAQILQIHSNVDKLPYIRPTITAQFIGQKCACGKPEYYLPETGKLVLESPGSEEIPCPSLSCQTTIKINVTQVEEGMVELLYFHVFVDMIARTDLFEISRGGEVIYRSTNRMGIGHRYFGSPYQDHVINYQTTDNDRLKEYNVQVSRKTVPKECYCDLIKTMKIREEGKFFWKIPKTCAFIYCHWDLYLGNQTDNDSYQTVIEFYLKDGSRDDSIEIFSGRNQQEFFPKNYDYKKSHSTTDKNPRIVFKRISRPPVIEDTELSIEWRYEKIMSCGNDTKMIQLTTEPFVLSKHGEKGTYREAEECWYLFSAPEGHTIHIMIEDIWFVSYHDKLRFYQGNTTDTLIKTLTLNHKHRWFDIDGRQTIVQFNTDGGNERYGFSINLVPVKQEKTATVEPLPTIPSDDEQEQLIEDDILVQELRDSEKILSELDGLKHTEVPENMKIPTGNLTGSSWIFVICLIFILMAGMLVYKYRYSISSQMEYVRFSRDEFGSSVSIARNEQPLEPIADM